MTESCSPDVLCALALCLTIPNTWSINLTLIFWLGAYTSRRSWLETVLGNIVVVL